MTQDFKVSKLWLHNVILRNLNDHVLDILSVFGLFRPFINVLRLKIYKYDYIIS